MCLVSNVLAYGVCLHLHLLYKALLQDLCVIAQ